MVQIQVHHATFLSSPILAVFPTVRSSFGPMLPLTHEHFFIHAAAEELRMVAHMIGDRPGRGKRRLKARGGIILQPYSLTILTIRVRQDKIPFYRLYNYLYIK